MTDQPTGPSQKVRAAGAALASVAGFALAGPEVGVVLGPALAPYAEQLLDRVREELRWRGGRFFGVAIHASEMAPEDFVEAASGRTELLALLNRVLGYAATALLADKVVALGLTYGKAVGDQAMIDECTLRADVIGALEGPHLRVLRLLAADVPDQLRVERLNEPDDGWTHDKLMQADHGIGRVTLPTIVGQLQQLGVIWVTPVQVAGATEEGMTPHYSLTPLGHQLVLLFQEVERLSTPCA